MRMLTIAWNCFVYFSSCTPPKFKANGAFCGVPRRNKKMCQEWKCLPGSPVALVGKHASVRTLFTSSDSDHSREATCRELFLYRGIQVRYPPLIRYWKVNFRSSDFHISYWEKISKNLADLQRGDPLQKAIRPSNYSEIWRRHFQNSYWKQIGRAAAS